MKIQEKNLPEKNGATQVKLSKKVEKKQVKSNLPSLKSFTKSTVEFGKRGMNFEAEINATNDYYLTHGMAVVHKKPTPIQIVKVDYPKRSRAKITEAYFRQASTTDYSGVWQGKYIDFEAKETQQKTVFPLKNFHDHQIIHMENVIKQGGIAFVLLHFATLNATYLLPASNLIKFYYEKHGLKSIPLDFIKKYGHEITTEQIPRIPYLDILIEHYEVQKNQNDKKIVQKNEPRTTKRKWLTAIKVFFYYHSINYYSCCFCRWSNFCLLCQRCTQVRFKSA